ncbi:hypothetical protein GS881_21500 [Rhodococcus hoagii]|nr:hypothetical protein [Prescottella equi]
MTAPSTAETGQQVTLSVAVSPVPTGGTVQFSVAGTDVGAPVSLDGSGQASMPYTFGAAGSFSVAAVYSGTTGFAGSTAAAHTVVVSDPAPVDVATSTLVGVPESAITGAPTTLSVMVQAQSGSAVPTGSVQFRDNGNPIGSPWFWKTAPPLSLTTSALPGHTRSQPSTCPVPDSSRLPRRSIRWRCRLRIRRMWCRRS